MKKLLILLSFTPVLCFGQAKQPNNTINGLVTCLHYDTAVVTGPVTVKDDYDEEEILKTVTADINYRGNVAFKIGFTVVKCDAAVANEHKQLLVASHVRIYCLLSPVLMGEAGV